MALIVQKFGGTSLTNVNMIRRVASRIIELHTAGDDLVIILSAMAGVTDSLIQLAREVSSSPDKRELDVLLATGEQVAVSMLAMMLKHMGYKAQSTLAYQIGLVTDSSYGSAKITSVDADSINKIIRAKTIAIIAGFQGCDNGGNITTLGRGGSDISAVAIAAALKADLCEIYTDVDGVYTADPNICSKARKLYKVSYDEMFCMANLGTKVLHRDSISFAKNYNIALHVRSSFSFDKKGTIVASESSDTGRFGILGIAYDLDYSRILLRGIPNNCDIATEILSPIDKSGISVDMLIQNMAFNGRIDMMLTVLEEDFIRTLDIGKIAVKSIGALDVVGSRDNAKISVVGLGINKNTSAASSILKVLRMENIDVIMMTMSEVKISCIVKEKDLKTSVKLLHSVFDLG